MKGNPVLKIIYSFQPLLILEVHFLIVRRRLSDSGTTVIIIYLRIRNIIAIQVYEISRTQDAKIDMFYVTCEVRPQRRVVDRLPA